MNSQRLPNKVLLSLPRGSKYTVLDRVIQRVKKSNVDKVALAVAYGSQDIIPHAEQHNIWWFQASKKQRNVLGEFLEICNIVKPRLIVRITADCPCIDPSIINEVIIQHDSTNSDYTCSRNDDLLYGDGFDVEVFTYKALLEGGRLASKPSHFEHVTKIFYEKGSLFKVWYAKELNLPREKYSLDTLEDYEKINKIYERFGDNFTVDDL